MFRGRWNFQILCAAVTVSVAFAIAPSLRAETFMTVSDVPVDVTAKDANTARDQAIATAQSKAFDRLVKRLVPNPADEARLHPSQQDIESYVQDFAVENERVSSVRYIGLYSVRFRESRIRKYLADSGVGAVGDQQQVLVVPVYRTADGALLWESENGWRAAWDRGGFGDGPVTLILPNGDSSDTGSLTAAAAASGDAAAIGGMIQRYHVAGLVVAVAMPRDPARGAASGFAVTATTYDQSGAKGTQTLIIDPVAGEQPDKALLRGVGAVSAALESGWSQAIAAKGSTGLTGGGQSDGSADQAPGGAVTSYPIGVPLAGIESWVKVHNLLAGTPGVQRVALDALTRDGAALTLDFAGDVIALQTALSNSGYVLVQTSPGTSTGPGSFQLRPPGFAPLPGAAPAAQ